jgi:DNA helicase-2/ATP-dependent DNA helicase PcrA
VEADIEEERRLFYVTITRAKKYLYIVNARMRMLFGDRSVKAESSFIKEIDEECLLYENEEKKVTPTIKREDKFYDTDVDYKPGDHVYHDEFKEGIVISVDKSIITVSFPYPYQVKKLMKNHKSIKKI